MSTLRWVWRNLEKLSQISTLVLTVAVLILSAIGVWYAARAYWNPPLELAVTGISAGQIIRENIVVTFEVSGRNVDTIGIGVLDSTGDIVLAHDATPGSSLEIDSSSIPDGSYSLSVDAVKGGNSKRRIAIPFSVDNTGPEIAFTGIREQAVVRGIINPAWTTDSTAGTVSLRAQIDESALIQSGFLDTRRLADGYHSLSIDATDQYDNRTNYTVTFIVDNTPPALEVVEMPQNGLMGQDSCLEVATRDAGNVQVAWYDAVSDELVANSQFLPSNVLKQGSQLLRAEAVDEAGNIAEIQREVFKDDTPPSVLDSIPDTHSVLHSRGILVLNYMSSEPVGRVLSVNGVELTGRLLRLGRIQSDSVVLTAEYSDAAGNKLEKLSVIVLEDSLEGTLGFLSHLGDASKVAIIGALERTFERSISVWNRLGVGFTGWSTMPPWEKNLEVSRFVTFDNELNVSASLGRGFASVRTPLCNLGLFSELPVDLSLELGGYGKIVAERLLGEGDVDGSPWSYEQDVRSGGWLKLCLKLDIAEALMGQQVSEMVNVDILMGVGVSTTSKTLRTRLTYHYTDLEDQIQQRSEYLWKLVSTVGGLFPVFQLAIGIRPLSDQLRDAILRR